MLAPVGSVALLAFADTAKPSGIRVVEPETLNGRSKVSDPRMQAVGKGFVDSMKARLPGLIGAVGVFYGDPAARNVVGVNAVAIAIADPQKEIDQNVAGMKRSGVEVSDATAVEAGPLGGVAQCGSMRVIQNGTEAGTVCIWADAGSVGVVQFYLKGIEDAKREFLSIRELVEKRS
jgi:hypothetical protein